LRLPQWWRINRQLKQRDLIGQLVFKNGGNNVWHQAGQIDQPADITAIDVFAISDFLKRFDLARFQHVQPSVATGQLQRRDPGIRGFGFCRFIFGQQGLSTALVCDYKPNFGTSSYELSFP
jgi:hypothetical protein